MLRLRYTPLVSVQFTHAFYPGGVCPDFALTPTPATQALLRAYDWVARPGPGGLQLLGREDEPGQPNVPLDGPVRLVLLVQLLNPRLPAVSEVAGGGPFYFSNLNPADGALRATLTAGPTLGEADRLPPLAGQQLALPLERGRYQAVALSRLELNAGGQLVQRLPVGPAQETAALRVAQPGHYALALEPADGAAPTTRELYLSDELAAGPPFFGLIELTLAQTPAAPLAYAIAMASRQTQWRYFLVDAKAKPVPVGLDGAGQPDLQLVYAAPQPPDPAYPGALSGATPIATAAGLAAEAQALEASAADPARPPAQRQADRAQLRQLRADLGLMEALRADRRVRAVYLARLPDALPVVQYAAPRLSLKRPGSPDLALPVPTADTPNATIFYTF